MRFLVVAAMMLIPWCLTAAQHSGSVRAADQFIPGATVTARNGAAKVVAYTDENGRYVLDLAPGAWDIQIDMFGFAPLHGQITMGLEPVARDWTLEMPRPGAPAPAATNAESGKSATPAAAAEGKPSAQPAGKPAVGTSPAATTAPSASRNTDRAAGQGGNRPGGGRYGQGRGANGGPGGRGANAAQGRGGQNPQQPGPGFQNMSVTATEEGAQALASAANEPPPDLGAGGDTSDSYLVTGSMSGGLAAATDEQARRDRLNGGRGAGGPGGPGGPGGTLGLMGDGLVPNGGFAGADPLGMSGFGAAGANSGFGADNLGGFGPPGGRGGGPGGGGAGARGGGGGGGGRGGGGAGGRGGRGGNAPGRGRGPFNGQFASFGNRRRTQPAYTGSVAVTVTNSALNAAPFSLNGQSQPKPSSARESITGNIGGPLRIPKLVTNDKWQVYLNISESHNRNARNQVSTVPTLAERNGDFSAAVVRNLPVSIYDPLNNTPFPGNIIPATRFNPASVGLLQYFPAPLFSGIVQNYGIAPSTPSDSHSVGFRLSGSVTNKDRLNFNQQYNGNGSTTEQLFGFQDTSSGYGLSSTAGWSHSFKPRFNNSANFSFSRNISKAAPYFAYKDNVAANLGIAGPDETPIDYGPPNLSFTNFGSLTDGTASVNRSQTANFTDNVTYVVHRNHNITFGLGYRRMQQNTLSYANSRGSFSFGGLLTSGLDSSGKTLPNTGFDFADFLLGYPQTSSLRIGNSNNYFRGWAANGSVQDDWRVNRGLTLNLGLRYEYFSPYTELFGHLANLDLNPGLTAASIVTAGGSGPYSGQFPNSLINGDPNNFSPRIGFAWRPTQKHSRVIRGGYSIFYSGSSYPQMAARMAAQPPFARTGSLATSLANPLTLQNGFPTQPSSTITNTFAVDRNYKLAYAQTWTIALQQTLPHNVLMELEYVGTKGTGLDVVENPNQTPPGSPASTVPQIANANAFTYETDHANSIFHAGQVRMTRRFTRGMSAVALYTFSKSIDDASSFTGGGGGTLVQNPLNLSAERSLSSSDQRHRLTLTYLLSSPVGIHGLWRNGGWKTTLFTGWTLNGTFTANSGAPLTAYVSGNLAGTTKGNAISGNFRAEATGLSVDSGAFPFFNENAFVAPPDGQYGNAGRNTIPGPALISLSGALNRAWRFSDTRRQLQLRLSANNALNHVQITGFGTTVNSATYGLPTAASGTRTVTLNLRFGF
jgi:hypothetical protein